MAGLVQLEIWLSGLRVAEAAEVRSGKLTLRYTDEAQTRWPAQRQRATTGRAPRPAVPPAPAGVVGVAS